jgi:alkanesulfonate monooxygenase SsuD/methylene tetrahydromethanopterin reductase-like flavin-dependent oxidoreductase (luciferase family)
VSVRLTDRRDTIPVSVFDLCHYPYETDPGAFEPTLAQRVYGEHLEEWTAAERLGYDAVFLTEHHFTAYNLLPSPNVMLAALAARTTELRIGAMINVVPFHEPLRLAEEGAMLDVLSGGRLEVGVGRGIDYQEVVKLGMDFDELRPRLREGMELMLKAWAGVEFEHAGEHYRVGRTPIYPRPLQRPHPPVWVAADSPATIEWAAASGFGTAALFVPTDEVAERLPRFVELGTTAGRELTPWHLMLVRNCHVAETDEQALAEAEPALLHMLLLFKNAAMPPEVSLLPDSYAYHREAFRQLEQPPERFQDLIDAGLVLCGSPATVREQALEQLRTIGTRQLCLWFAFGNLTHEQVMRSQELFAREVMPAVRGLASEARAGARSARAPRARPRTSRAPSA